MVTLSRIAPEIPVLDLQASLAYYETRLGFRTAMVTPAGDYAIVERDAVAIHLFQPSSQTISPVGVHIFTHEIEELYLELERRGAYLTNGVVLRPWGNRDFRVMDQSGNELKFTEPAPDEE